MEAKTGNLLFSRRLLAAGAQALREKLVHLADRHLAHDIRVDTLTGMHFAPESHPPDVRSFLFFDFHRIFLYENSDQPDGPAIDSVVRHLIDDYPIPLVRSLADYSREQFHFFYPPEILEILPLLWTHRRPGTLITLDLSAPEIRMAQVTVHPECERPHIEKSGPACLAAGNGAPGLKDCFTGPDMRARSNRKLDDLISPEAGIIRRERKIMSRLSFPAAVTQIAAGSGVTFSCGGRTTNMPAAVHAARCEAVERFQVNFLNPRDSLVYGPYEKFGQIAIDPETLCFDSIRTSPSARYVPYDRNLPIYWSSVRNPRSGETRLAPAQEISFNTRSLPGENLCLMSSTNACALGSSFEEAALFAILEAVERDAFLTTWYLRRRCARLIPASIRSEAFQLLWHRFHHTYRNYSIVLFDITTEVAIPVVLCVAVKQSGHGPQVMLSAACRLQTDEAACAALKDLSALQDPAVYDDTLARKLLDRPEDVAAPEDHAAYYSLPETFPRLSFLGFEDQPRLAAQEADQVIWIPRRSRHNLRVVIEEILDRLSAIGITVFLKNLTHREFLRRELFCARAIVPEFYPMWFGYYSIRFRMSDRLTRLSERFTGTRLNHVSQINLEIHPFD